MCDRKIRKSIPLFDWLLLEFFIMMLGCAVFSTNVLTLCLATVYFKYGITLFRVLTLLIAVIVCLNGMRILHVTLYVLNKGIDIYIIPFVHVRILVAYLKWKVAIRSIRSTNSYETSIPVDSAIYAAKRFYYKDLLTYVEDLHIILRRRDR